MAQTRTALLLWLHARQSFASITGEATLRLAFFVVFQIGGVCEKNTRAASDESWIKEPRYADAEAETSRCAVAECTGEVGTSRRRD